MCCSSPTATPTGCGVGDENGQFINQLRVYGLLAYYLLEVRGQRGAIVKTLSTTTMLNKLGQIYNVPVYETGVGFKYVAPKMLETDALIGGEESGGYAFRGNVPERDGILAGLYMLDLMVRLGKKPTELLKLLFAKVGGEYFYDRIDRPFTGSHADRKKMILDANPQTIGGLKVTELVTVDGFQFKLEDGGWMLIRFSGTEPIMRVYCETMHADKVQAILQDGLKIAGLEIISVKCSGVTCHQHWQHLTPGNVTRDPDRHPLPFGSGQIRPRPGGRAGTRRPGRGRPHILIPGLNLPSSRAAVKLAGSHPMLYAAVGVHPTEAATWDKSPEH